MYQYRKLTPEQKAEVVNQRISRGYPPHSPPHTIRDKELYFITAPCYEHKHHMATEARRQQVQDLLIEQLTNNHVEILAWVVLPNHYHLLVHVENFDAIGKSLRIVHGRTSRFWNLEDNATGRKVWYAYYDKFIRSEYHYYTVINYIHNNPVKHRYAKSIYDWNQSSANWYLLEYGQEWMSDFFAKYYEENFGKDWDCAD